MLRRDFIRSSALVAGAIMTTPLPVFAADEKIPIGVVGTGWWGTDVLLASLLKNPNYDVVALCDVNSLALDNAASVVKRATGKAPTLFSNYKKMYEVPGLKAVAIATPTHWHPLQFIDACRKGLHVFLEKPLSYDIAEGLAMLEAHRKAKNVVVVDFPRTMVDTNQRVREFINSGAIGKVVQVQANIHNPEGPIVEKPVPPTFDYEQFCGPAPRAKFMCGPTGDKPAWRQQLEFSRGVLVDWGIHYVHNIRQVLGLGIPDNVSAIGGTVRNLTTQNPDHLDVRFNFSGLPVYWTHRAWGYTSPTPQYDIGVFYYGEKGTIFAGDLGFHVFMQDGTKKEFGSVEFDPGNSERTPVYDKMITDIFDELANGIRKGSGVAVTNTLEEAQKTTSTVIYGDIAYRTRAEIQIDRQSFNIKNNKAAQAMLKRDYRAPYQHPA